MSKWKTATGKSLYGSRWRAARSTFLKSNPFCIVCKNDRIITAATVVDHIVPHKGDLELFWDTTNWQPMCKTHHDAYKQKFEKTGLTVGCDEKGLPIDRNHHWNN